MTRTSNEIIKDAERVLIRQEKLRKEMREIEQRVRSLCLEFGAAERCWGLAPHHLRQAVEARTNRKIVA